MKSSMSKSVVSLARRLRNSRHVRPGVDGDNRDAQLQAAIAPVLESLESRSLFSATLYFAHFSHDYGADHEIEVLGPYGTGGVDGTDIPYTSSNPVGLQQIRTYSLNPINTIKSDLWLSYNNYDGYAVTKPRKIDFEVGFHALDPSYPDRYHSFSEGTYASSIGDPIEVAGKNHIYFAGATGESPGFTENLTGLATSSNPDEYDSARDVGVIGISLNTDNPSNCPANGGVSSHPIFYGSGGALMSFNDFLPSDSPVLKMARSWSNSSQSVGTQSASFGSGMSFDALPYLVNESTAITNYFSDYPNVNNDALFRVVDSSSSAFGVINVNGKFSNSGSLTNKKEIFGHNASNHTISRLYPDGTVDTYADFDNATWGAGQGQLISRTTPSREKLQVVRNVSGQLVSMDWWSGNDSTQNASAPDESFAFTYSTGNQVSQVVQYNAGSAVRTVNYSYYDGISDTTNGRAGDLKFVTKQNGTSAVVDTNYYRWYTSNTSTGYAGGLKLFMGDEAYQKAVNDYGSVAAVVGADTTGTNGLTNYADNYFEYDTNGDTHRVTKEIALGSGLGCSCGNTGEGTYTFAYQTNTNTNLVGRNIWQTRTTETLPDNSQNIVYTNQYGDAILNVKWDVSAGKSYSTWRRYNDQGNVVLQAEGNAIAAYDPANPASFEGFADLIGYGATSGSKLASNGRVDVTNYFTIADTADATLYPYQKNIGFQKGANTATFVKTESWDYFDGGVAGDGVWNVLSDTTYPNANGSAARVTTYSYDFWQSGGVNTAQLKTVTTSMAQVSAAQNGADGTSAGGSSTNYQTKTYYDSAGRVVWYVDGDGYITYTAYDPLTGMKVKQVQDANPATITNVVVAGLPTRTGALNLTTLYGVAGTSTDPNQILLKSDPLGRWTKRIDPNGNITYKVYDDTTADGTPRSVKTYTGWNSTTHQPTGPVYATIDDPATGIRDTVTYTYAGSTGLPVDTNGVPTGGEWSNISHLHVQSLSRALRNVSDQVVEKRQYIDFTGLSYDPSSSGWATLGTSGTNYLSTKYKYDAGGRQFQTTTPNGTVTRTIYDARGLASSQWVGVAIGTDYDAANNRIKVAEFAYDADGNQTQATEYPHDGSADRVTKFYYDFRDRLVATQTGAQAPSGSSYTSFLTYTDYDNLDEATATATYNWGAALVDTAENNGAGDGVPDKPAYAVIRSLATTQYDDQGRVFATHRFSVNPYNYAAVSSDSIDTNYWYDRRGDLIKTQTSGSAVQKTTYDGAGRETADYTTDGGGDSTWADAGNVTDDTVVEQMNTAYDAAGNVILTTQKRRFHDATGTGALGRPTSGVRARLYYRPSWYDAANRLVATAEIGTNFGTDYTRGNNPPVRSDTKLVTSYDYDDAGRLAATTDPKGIVGRTFYDPAGRTTKTVANYVQGGVPSDTDNQTTEYTYTPDSQILTQTARLPNNAFQTTAFVYGSTTARGDGVNDNDVLIATQYPDPATGAASSSQQETYTTNALGERTTFTDRNGTTHTYSRDVLGRTTLDAVTTLGSGVDGAVRAIGTTYGSIGLPEYVTSYSDAAATSVVNQTWQFYNGLGQVTGQIQSHSGTAWYNKPSVQYGYSSLASGSRLTTMTYPNGRVINYNYVSGLDDAVGRLSSIGDSSGTLEAYQYLGLGTVVVRSHPQTGVALSYVRAAGEPTGDAGDQYTGLDRFDRVVNQKWVNAGGTVVDQNTYTYDRDGNVLSKANPLNTALGEAYAYDSLNRLASTARNGAAHQAWSLDALGNSNTVTTDGTATARTNDKQNRLTQVGTTTLAYDADGNTTTDEYGRTLAYDAWNRMVEAKSGTTSLVRYAYDGLNRRIKDGTTDVYFNTSWQIVEERNAANQAVTQKVWSVVYVDAMVEQDRDTDADGTLDQRLYPTQDANWNVTAVTNAGGAVQVRYAYDAYGTRQVLDPTTYAVIADPTGFRQGFQGGTYEAALPNLILFRNRMYDTATMRWVSEDPLGTVYQDGMNLANYLRNNPFTYSDPSGLCCTWWQRHFGPRRITPIPGVYICDGYIAGTLFGEDSLKWNHSGSIGGGQAAHNYLLVDGKGYGFYANSHIGGPPDYLWGVGVIATAGKVVGGDEGKYPPVDGPTSMKAYSRKRMIYIEGPECEDPAIAKSKAQAIHDAIKSAADKELGTSHFYGAGTYDCDWWVKHIVSQYGDGAVDSGDWNS